METQQIHTTCTYQIEVCGRIDVQDLETMSPLKLETVQMDDASAATIFTVCADQSGLIGLLRHLHARRLVFLSVTRVYLP
jgi:hypothetical protein